MLVLVADQGPVRVLTLNRPAARNALSRDLIRAPYSALTEADADESVHAVVLTGADPAFCAGVDLKEAQRDGSSYFEEFRSQSCIAATAEDAHADHRRDQRCDVHRRPGDGVGLRLPHRVRARGVRRHPRPRGHPARRRDDRASPPARRRWRWPDGCR